MPYDLTVGDFDGEGNIDIAIANPYLGLGHPPPQYQQQRRFYRVLGIGRGGYAYQLSGRRFQRRWPA